MLRPGYETYAGGIYVELPDWKLDDWAYVSVRARSTSMGWMELNFNLREEPGQEPDEQSPFLYSSQYVDMIQDGSVQTYLMRADWPGEWKKQWEGPWRRLGIRVGSRQPASIDILSVSVIPKEAEFASARTGVKSQVRGNSLRRALYTHTPAGLAYAVRVPEGGRLDLGLGVLRDQMPVSFKVAARAEGRTEVLLEESYADRDHWAQRSIDLSGLAGQTISLSLETDAEREGLIALWAAPTLSGRRTTHRPNIVFYIIDAGAVDYMSVFGYNRHTTPHLERLAREGAVFERAYSNSTWSKTSTPSFMTSLQHSVLGGYENDSDPLPDQAATMAQHLHRSAYQTGVFVSNPYAGTMTSLDREVDRMREAGVEPNTISSTQLHEDFWEWRTDYPSEPYWVHFQTTDVHWPWKPSVPFAGLFVSSEQRQKYYAWERELAEAAGMARPTWLNPHTYPLSAFEKTGIDRFAFFGASRSLYDEAMAHNDYQIGRLVERLKERGEWENTLFIVAADHGNGHALGLSDPLPTEWSPIFRSAITRIPLIMVWPGGILPEQRFREPVSMIDMLPTILDLAGLPPPQPTQGQSLAPLLQGREGWKSRPVILEEFYVHSSTRKMFGKIDVVDGRWGASLEPLPDPEEGERPESARRPAPLILYDLWNDPQCLNSLHEAYPELVKKYTDFLRSQHQLSRVLGERFTRSTGQALSPAQLRTLRSLGYIQ